MDWNSTIKGFASYLKLERSLSPNTVERHMHDVHFLHQFFQLNQTTTEPEKVTMQQLQTFIIYINELGLADYSQARILSGVRAFYKYMLMEDITDVDPTLLIEGPKLKRKLPDTLSLEEI